MNWWTEFEDVRTPARWVQFEEGTALWVQFQIQGGGFRTYAFTGDALQELFGLDGAVLPADDDHVADALPDGDEPETFTSYSRLMNISLNDTGAEMVAFVGTVDEEAENRGWRMPPAVAEKFEAAVKSVSAVDHTHLHHHDQESAQ